MIQAMFVYLESRSEGIWTFEGERHENVDYDETDPGDQPVYAPIPLYSGVNPPLQYLFGYQQRTIIGGTGPAFPTIGIPPDISAELATWSRVDDLNHGHSWVSVRELVDFDWYATMGLRQLVTKSIVSYYEHPGTRIRDPGEAILPPVHPDAQAYPNIYVELDRHLSYEHAAGSDFMTEVVHRLAYRYGPSEAARIIYWFA